MPRTIRKGNPLLVHTLLALRQAAKRHEAPIWAAVAERLNRGRHQGRPLNVGQLDRLSSPEDFVVVPGKLLSQGRLTKPVTVAALSYSLPARAKVEAAGGKALTFAQLIESRPSGEGVRLLA